MHMPCQQPIRTQWKVAHPNRSMGTLHRIMTHTGYRVTVAPTGHRTCRVAPCMWEVAMLMLCLPLGLLCMASITYHTTSRQAWTTTVPHRCQQTSTMDRVTHIRHTRICLRTILLRVESKKHPSWLICSRFGQIIMKKKEKKKWKEDKTKQTNPWGDAMGLKKMIQWFLAMTRTPVCVNVVLPFICEHTWI